ncbi:exported hypothetical protein [Desulfamplus magnetovallimortis]|uniref:DUF1573 domain-containing protein n=3 Tax=Desulfamplus magnetovallimortis TaxID=1246637 RepID=A0A1W1HD13_9BACT|nr:exported hypothetical protein [Desulfamplus magnetovallimortis]
MSNLFRTAIFCLALSLLFLSYGHATETEKAKEEAPKEASVKKDTGKAVKNSSQAETENNQVDKEQTQAPVVFFPDSGYTFEKVVEGVEITHDFVVINKGTAPLHIQKVKTG